MAGDKDPTEPAMILLLLLGLIALFAGLGSIGDLRRRHLMPPRSSKPPSTDKDEQASDSGHHSPKA